VLERVATDEHGQRYVYVNRGSRYHVGKGARDEEYLSHFLDSRRGSDRRRTRPWLHLNVGDVLVDAAHHQSFTIRYRSMPLEREISFFIERMGRMRQPIPERVFIIRSHVHGTLRTYEESGFLAVSTPSWKLQDDFAAMSRIPNRVFSEHIGAVGFRITQDNINVVKYLYDHPQPVCEVV
jgi:hypothetical protein